MTDYAATVALLTDYGADSWYVGTLKGALLSVEPRLAVVDITHSVPGQRIGDGSFILASTYRSFPPGTIFLAIVDPGVGSSRRGLAAQAGGYTFVAPDNGILTEVFEREPDREVRYLENEAYWHPSPRPTFHGRDIFAPVAAHLARGVSLGELGPVCAEPVELVLPEPIWNEDRVLSVQVILADPFGNLITDLREDRLGEHCEKLGVDVGDLSFEVAGRRFPGLKRTYHDALPGEPMALIGGSGYLEIAVNRGSARQLLGLAAGSRFLVRFGREGT